MQKSKAKATAIALNFAETGLDVSVVHPSGIIGPDDESIGNISSVIIRYCNGRLPFSVSGGYDFVNVRDVAAGILSCCEQGKKGECYILSNQYASIDNILSILSRRMSSGKPALLIPYSLLKIIAPVTELISKRLHKMPFLTSYSVYTMHTSSTFSHEKASNELMYNPRAIEVTLNDTVDWLAEKGLIIEKKERK